MDAQLRQPLMISLGAIAGALCRHYLGLWLLRGLGSAFPYGTLFVNLTGSFLMGLLISLGARRLSLSPDVMLTLAVGFLGSYTTFSSYQLDTLRLMGENRGAIALLYWVGSPILGAIGIQLGVLLGRWGSTWWR